MVRIDTARCQWCRSRGHTENECIQKQNKKLPNNIKLRRSICNNILKKYVYRKYFSIWVGRLPEPYKHEAFQPKPKKEASKWISAISRKRKNPVLEQCFWQWYVCAETANLQKLKGIRWADL